MINMEVGYCSNMKKFNAFFRKNLFYLVLTSMFFGFLFGWQFQDFAPWAWFLFLFL